MLPIPDSVLRLPERQGSPAIYDLLFRAVDLPPLSARSYYIRKVSSDFVPITPTDDATIGDEVSVYFLYVSTTQ